MSVGLLKSPRRRRRFAFGAILAAAGLTIALLIVFERNTSPAKDAKLTNEPVAFPQIPKRAKHTHAENVRALTVAAEFVRTAVARQHPERGWDVASPTMKGGDSRETWTGKDPAIPVPPYPVRLVKWKPDYSYKNAIGLQVALFPKPKTPYKPMVFFIDLKRYGQGKNGHWLVESWSPAPGAASFGIAAGTASGGGGGPLGDAVAQATGDSVLGASWLLLPIGIFVLALLIPILVGIRGWIRDRRQDRLAGKALPPLGNYGSSERPS